MARKTVVSKVVLLSGFLLLALCLPATAKPKHRASVPDGDPASWGLLGAGMLTMGILQRKRRTES